MKKIIQDLHDYMKEYAYIIKLIYIDEYAYCKEAELQFHATLIFMHLNDDLHKSF